MHTIGTMLAAMLVLVCVPVAYGQGVVPAGDGFQVNSYTTNDQVLADVARLADGGFVVTWTSYRPAPRARIIQGQRYAADGTALGGQFQVSSPGYQLDASVAGLADGGFVVVWYGDGPDDSDPFGNGIRGQRYAADGTALADQFQANTYIANHQTTPSVTGLAVGGFVVVWKSYGSSGTDSSSSSIQGQRYAADGTALGDELQINSYTTFSQTDPSVAGLIDGGFVVTWQSTLSGGSDTSYRSVQGQRHAADGTALGAQFQVNSYTFNDQRDPAVAALADGGFVVLWESQDSADSPPSGLYIQSQRYAADGTAVGGEVQVNSRNEHEFRRRSAVTGMPDGGFMAAWYTFRREGPDTIQGRRFGVDGVAIGGELALGVSGSSSRSSLAPLDDGGLVAVWSSMGSNGSDTSGKSVQGRRFALPRFALSGLGGKCLEVEGGDPADGTPVILSGCHGGDNQIWRLDLTTLPQPVVATGGECLVPGVADASGNIGVTIGPCDGPATRWRLAEPVHAAPSTLNLSGTDLCLDVEGGASDDGTPVILSECQGGAGQLWRPAVEVCVPDSLGLCLNQERYRVDLEWRSFDDTTGFGRAVPVGSDDSGLLWFFETDNWELLIKVLDGCAINDRLWVFAAATTTVEYTLRVTDTRTGDIREYTNPLGNAAAAITDTDAFATCPAGAAVIEDPPAVARAVPEPRSTPAVTRLKGACVPTANRMCLNDDRFQLAAAWRDYAGNTGPARPVDAGSADDTSGLFWFFNSDNWELLVKVIDACDINDRFLFLGAATTDVQYTLAVTDTATGVSWLHTNPLGNPSAALVHWFDTCP